MSTSQFERRHEARRQQQQQPQQSVFTPGAAAWVNSRATQESPRKTWQALAQAQAKKQSSKL
jgi:hypothetical protein